MPKFEDPSYLEIFANALTSMGNFALRMVCLKAHGLGPRRARTSLVPLLLWLLHPFLLPASVVEEVSSVVDLPDMVLCGDAVSCGLGGPCPLLQDEVVHLS